MLIRVDGSCQSLRFIHICKAVPICSLCDYIMIFNFTPSYYVIQRTPILSHFHSSSSIVKHEWMSSYTKQRGDSYRPKFLSLFISFLPSTESEKESKLALNTLSVLWFRVPVSVYEWASSAHSEKGTGYWMEIIIKIHPIRSDFNLSSLGGPFILDGKREQVVGTRSRSLCGLLWAIITWRSLSQGNSKQMIIIFIIILSLLTPSTNSIMLGDGRRRWATNL